MSGAPAVAGTRSGPLVGVVFDLDGVLVESEHLWEENWVAYAAAHAYDWRPDDTATVQGMSVPEWSGYIAQRIGHGSPPAIAGRVIDGMIAALADGRIALLPGAAPMVAAAAARVPVGVASSAPRRLIEAVLSATGLLPHMGTFVSSEQVSRGKPSPDVYQEAARRLGLDPFRCLAVEDSSNGITSAAAAGMTVVAIPNPVYPPKPEALALCTFVAASPTEVERLLRARLPAPADTPADTPAGAPT